jgi:UDP-2,3-diacylglucosamine pyrophosphatase LpxH
MHHTVVISDIHLSENEPGDGLWMRYRQAPYAPDAEIAAMLEELLTRVDAADRVTLVLDGDVFDFDAPRVKRTPSGAKSVFHDDPRDDAHDAPATERILEDHPVFVDAMGAFLAAGHSVVLVSGNHDAQVTLPGVREVVRRRFVDAAIRHTPAESAAMPRASIEERVGFRGWFFLTEDGILVEHGHQYDPYCVYRYPLAPFAPGADAEPRVKPTLGSLATRLLTGRMGYFNPHVDQTYTLGAAGYFRHWFRRYLFSRHSLGFAWFFGSLRTAMALMRERDAGDHERAARNEALAARECGVSAERLVAHARLFATPAEQGMRRVLRELYLDRLAVVVACVAFAAAWWLLGPDGTWWAPFILAVGAILYEARLPGATVHDRWRDVDDVMECVAEVHGARAIVFGHTHHAHARFSDRGTFIANVGTWSSAYIDLECEVPAHEERPLVWLTSDGPVLRGGLFVWTGERIEPSVVGEARVSHAVDSNAVEPNSSEAAPLLGDGRSAVPAAADSLGGMIADITTQVVRGRAPPRARVR